MQLLKNKKKKFEDVLESSLSNDDAYPVADLEGNRVGKTRAHVHTSGDRQRRDRSRSLLPVGCPAYDGGLRTSLASAMHSAVAPGSMAHASTNFDGDKEALKKYLEENDCTVIVFAHWCGHCKNLLSMVHDLRSKMPADELKPLITVDADKHPDFVQDNHVKGFPATFTNQKGSGQLTPVALNTQDVLMNCTLDVRQLHGGAPGKEDRGPASAELGLNRKRRAQ